MMYPKLTEEIKNSCNSVSKEILLEKSLGVLLGTAVGNILGIPLEFCTYNEISKISKITCDPIELQQEWDDDLYLTILLGEALEQEDPIKVFIDSMIEWKNTCGRGIGITTSQVINHYSNGIIPPIPAVMVWQQNNHIAPNGGVMRCAPVAIKYCNNPKKMLEMTTATCEITHYDPKCIASCLFVNAIISIYLNNGTPDVYALYNAIKKDTGLNLYKEAIKDKILPYFLYSLEKDTYLDHNLEDFYNYTYLIGHTLTALQFGIFVTDVSYSFNEALLKVIETGGDTDTNGAVAGAILGARYGCNNIPDEWKNCISSYDRITSLAERLVLND